MQGVTGPNPRVSRSVSGWWVDWRTEDGWRSSWHATEEAAWKAAADLEGKHPLDARGALRAVVKFVASMVAVFAGIYLLHLLAILPALVLGW